MPENNSIYSAIPRLVIESLWAWKHFAHIHYLGTGESWLPLLFQGKGRSEFSAWTTHLIKKIIKVFA